MTADDRDIQIAALIRREIDKEKSRAEAAGWRAPMPDWYITRGEIQGMRRILALVDPNPHS